MPLQVRRGTTAERGTITPLAGELIYDTQEGKLYVGDGATAGGVPASAYSDDDAQDAVFTALNHSDHTGIRFTYNDTANKITAIVNPDLSNYEGTISADGFKGSLFADDSTLIFNAATGTVSANFRGDLVGSIFADNSTILVDGVLAAFNLDGTIRTNIIPAVNEVYDLGSSGARFKDIYLSGTSIFLGDATITATGSAVNLPAGSTVGGVAIGTGSGSLVGDGVVAGSDYNINIVGDDSSSIINSSTRTVTAVGGFFGDLVGDVTGNVSGNVIGQRSGVFGQTLLDATSSSISVNNITADGISATVSGFFGNVQGNVTGVVTGLAGSTLIGDLVGTTTGHHDGTVQGSIYAQNSSILVEFDTGRHYGTFIGNVVGNVLGDVNGNFFGNLLGNVTGNLNGIVEGELVGSVYSDNSTLIVDAFNNRVLTDQIVSDNLTIEGTSISTTGTDLDINTLTLNIQYLTDPDTFEQPELRLSAYRGTLLSPTTVQDQDLIGGIKTFGYNGLDYVPGAVILFNVNDPSITTGSAELKTDIYIGQSEQLGNVTGNYVLIDSLGKITAPFVTSDLQGSVFSDGSTMLVNGTDGSLMYYPTTAGDWNGTAPTTVGEALDRIAAWIKLSDGTGA